MLQAASTHLPHREEAAHHKRSLLGFMVLHHLWCVPCANACVEMSGRAGLVIFPLPCLIPNTLVPACQIHFCLSHLMPSEIVDMLCIT